MKISTNGAGEITSALVYWTEEYFIGFGGPPAGYDNSWQGGTISFTGADQSSPGPRTSPSGVLAGQHRQRPGHGGQQRELRRPDHGDHRLGPHRARHRDRRYRRPATRSSTTPPAAPARTRSSTRPRTARHRPGHDHDHGRAGHPARWRRMARSPRSRRWAPRPGAHHRDRERRDSGRLRRRQCAEHRGTRHDRRRPRAR